MSLDIFDIIFIITYVCVQNFLVFFAWDSFGILSLYRGLYIYFLNVDPFDYTTDVGGGKVWP